MSNTDSEVEFDDEWEAVPVPEAPAAAAGPTPEEGITINLNDDDDDVPAAADASKKKRPAARVYTKHQRQQALMVHRAHCLCMLAHALLHDEAAADREVQALLLSLLPLELLDVVSAAATSEDPLARNWLPRLLHWFHRTFTVSTSSLHAQQQQQQQGSNHSSSSSRDRIIQELLGLSALSVQQQLVACVQSRRGNSTQLAAVLVALLRAVGFLTRSVWSLDALPFKPAAVDALEAGKSIRVTAAAAAAAAAAAGAGAAADTGSRQHGSSGRGGWGRGRTGSRSTAAAATADGQGRGAGRGSSRWGKGGGRGGQAGKAAAAGSRRTQQPDQEGHQDPSAAAGAAGGGGGADGDEPASKRRRRRGDEEFERELAMAMEATAAAEAASRQAASEQPSAAAAATAAAPPPPSGRGTRAGQAGGAAGAAAPKASRTGGHPGSTSSKQQKPARLASLIDKNVSPAVLKQAAAAATPALPAGWLWQPRPGGLSAPKVWAEVYVGGSADGRWLHVDGLLGCFDQPPVVEAAAVRHQPLSYVVACQEGAPKDVTRRYAANFTVNLKWRDEQWWGSTMAALRSSAAHLPRQLAAQVAGAAASAAGAATTAAAAATKRRHDKQQSSTDGHDAAVESQTQQQQQKCHQQKREHGHEQADAEQPKRRKRVQQVLPADSEPNSGGRSGSGGEDSDDGVKITADKAAPAVDSSAVGRGDGVLSGAALRAAREDAELSARAALQAAGPPSTIEGFKGHPLYVLERHITKYQAVRPGAVKLGLHKGEAFYSRQDVQELHTKERWEREGRQVRADELATPAKVVKKRSLPAAGGGSGRGRAWGRGGWGPWQRSNSTGSSKKGSDADLHGATATAAAAATSAATAADAAAATAGAGEAGEEVGSSMQQLYGQWQTEVFVRQAENGKVPRNDRGNVEVPPLAKDLPLGTKWIDAPNMAPICRSLGIDYAPALVGFEVQGGRMVPRIRGVVVCEEHEQAVIELHIKREAERVAVEQDKQRREAASAWKRLLQHMWTRLELQRKYVQGAPAGVVAATAAAGAGAAGSADAGSRRMQEIITGLNAAARGAVGKVASAAHDSMVSGVPVGQHAARLGGGRSVPGSTSRQLPPGVAAPLQGAAHPGPASGGVMILAPVEVCETSSPAQPVQGSARQETQQHQADALEGVEVEEF